MTTTASDRLSKAPSPRLPGQADNGVPRPVSILSDLNAGNAGLAAPPARRLADAGNPRPDATARALLHLILGLCVTEQTRAQLRELGEHLASAGRLPGLAPWPSPWRSPEAVDLARPYPLPLLDVGATLLGMTDAAGNLHLETTVSLPVQPAWVEQCVNTGQRWRRQNVRGSATRRTPAACAGPPICRQAGRHGVRPYPCTQLECLHHAA